MALYQVTTRFAPEGSKKKIQSERLEFVVQIDTISTQTVCRVIDAFFADRNSSPIRTVRRWRSGMPRPITPENAKALIKNGSYVLMNPASSEILQAITANRLHAAIIEGRVHPHHS